MGGEHSTPCRRSIFGNPLVYDGMREMHQRVGVFDERAPSSSIGKSRRGSVFVVVEHPWSKIAAPTNVTNQGRSIWGGHMSVFLDLDGNSVRDENGRIVRLAGLQYTLSADPIYRVVWYNKKLRYTRRACVDKVVWTDRQPFIVDGVTEVWELPQALDPFGLEQFAQPGSWQKAITRNANASTFERDLVEAINDREKAIPAIRARRGEAEHEQAYVDRLEDFVKSMPPIREHDPSQVVEIVNRSWQTVTSAAKAREKGIRENGFLVSLDAFLAALHDPFDFEPPTTSELDVWTMGQHFTSFHYAKAIVTVLLNQPWPEELEVLLKQQDWAESFVNTAIRSRDGIWDY